MIIKMIISIALLMFGTVFMLLGTKRSQRMQLLKTAGITVDGVIDDIINTETKEQEYNTYRINVTFITEKGDEIKDKLPFFPGNDFVKKFSKGDKIPITYFRKNPKLFTSMEYDRTDQFSLTFLLISITLFSLAAILNWERIFG